MQAITQSILKWYTIHKRPLPFREHRNPYHIAVSESMLQQTRMSTALPYYIRWMAKWPNLQTFQKSSLDEVITLWSGLGYYQRAKNLWALLHKIINDYQGIWPQTKPTLLSLPGVGNYTASAIMAIGFHIPIPVVDGNVRRIVCRITGQSLLPVNKIESIVANWIPKPHQSHPLNGDFAESLMDFGSLVCTKHNPTCESCVLQSLCKGAYHPQQYPALQVRKKPIVQYTVAYCIQNELGELLIEKRPNTGLLPNTFGVPLAPFSTKPIKKIDFFSVPLKKTPHTLIHTFTHITLYVHIYTGRINFMPHPYTWITPEIKNFPSLMKKILMAISYH